MSDYCFNAKLAISQLYHMENKLRFWWDVDDHFVLDQHAEFDFHNTRNNSLWVDMSLHSHTLFWFWANQSLLLLLSDACLVEKQQIPIFIAFALTRPTLEPMIYHIQGEHANHYPTNVVQWSSNIQRDFSCHLRYVLVSITYILLFILLSN